MDLSRIRSVFDALDHNETIAIVGLGAIGSRVASYLNDIGLGRNLVLIDHDVVDLTNLCSQMYRAHDVGNQKAGALNLLLGEKWFPDETEELRFVHDVKPVRVTNRDQVRYDVVITCLDSMRERRSVVCNAVFANGVTRYVMDARITATTIFAIGFDPMDTLQYNQYVAELYDDPPPEQDAAMGGCGITPSVATTAGIAAGLIGQLLINHLNGKKERAAGRDDGNVNEVVVDLRSWNMEARRYERTEV